MEYNLRLHKEPFEQIKMGNKHIEYRLNDEKRKLFKVGDTLVFAKRPEEVEKIKVKISALKYYEDLYTMYEDNFDELKNRYKSVQDAVKDTTYYTDEEIKKYGCVAIFFEKI